MSLRSVVWEFFKVNTSEGLTVDDASVKFEISKDQARGVLYFMKRMGLLDRRGHVYFYRSKL